MQQKYATDDEELCELCWNDHTASFRDHEGRPVCGTHANALEEGSWDGVEREVTPLTYLNELEYVFVYGTLRDRDSYTADLEGFRKDDTGRYPTLIPDEDGVVTGEIHKVTGDRLKELDRYESVPRLYKRVEGPMGVWMYIGDPDRLHATGELTFEQEFLEERAADATLTLDAGFDPRKMDVQQARQ